MTPPIKIIFYGTRFSTPHAVLNKKNIFRLWFYDFNSLNIKFNNIFFSFNHKESNNMVPLNIFSFVVEAIMIILLHVVRSNRLTLFLWFIAYSYSAFLIVGYGYYFYFFILGLQFTKVIIGWYFIFIIYFMSAYYAVVFVSLIIFSIFLFMDTDCY